MLNKFPRHQNISTNIDGKCIINNILRDGFYCVATAFIICCGIIQQDINMSILFNYRRIYILHSIFIGNIAFKNKIVSIHFH